LFEQLKEEDSALQADPNALSPEEKAWQKRGRAPEKTIAGVPLPSYSLIGHVPHELDASRNLPPPSLSASLAA
jgi:hypothetical protein